MQNMANYNDYLKLTKKQQEYIQARAEHDLNEKQLAEMIGVHNTTISKWKNDEKFMRGMKGYQVHFLDSHIPNAMRQMIKLLGAKSELVSYQAAKDILDRTGYVPVDKKEIELTGGVQFVDSIPKED